MVGNAVKFTQHGEVVVHARLVERTPESAVIRFEVADTGIGIPAGVAARLFEPFSQADSSMTRPYGGTGLGLAISKRLADQMGGEIGVDSEPGRGSTFWFTVRLKSAAAGATPAVEPPEQAAVQLPRLRVLVVDDNATNRRILQEQLAPSGMSVTAVADGPSALQSLRQGVVDGDPFAVAILDRYMPGVDGLAVAREVRADPSIGRTPIVLLTSLGEADRVDVAAAGLQYVLSKPVRQSQLLNTLAGVLGVQVTGTIAIPAPAPATRSLSSHESGGGNGPRILVAEDTTINQLVARRMLERFGCRVDLASNGQEVLDAVQRIPYALVLMDVRMPEMDGFEATAEIRKREAQMGMRTPIIAMTANAMEGDRERCIDAGMDDYLAKPIRLSDVEQVLRRWVYSDVPASESSVGANLEPWLVEAYLAEEPVIEDELRTALQTGDGVKVCAAAHKLQGTAAAVGAKVLASLCAELQGRGEDGSFDDAGALLQRLSAAASSVRLALDHSGTS
jgi:two-component system sensor histidine kinase/response regulator